MTKPLTIDAMYAFVADTGEAEVGEGIMGFLDQTTNQWIPMVGADMARVEQLYRMAELIALSQGVTFKVLKFSNREDITEQARDASLGGR